MALIAVASEGVWSMLTMVSLVIFLTIAYGAIFRRATWLQLPRQRSAAAIGAGIALAVFIGCGSAYGVTHPTAEPTTYPVVATTSHTATPAAAQMTTRHATPTPTPTPTHIITTKLVSETSSVPFQSATVQSATLAQGTSSITTAGADGVETKTYTVTYSDGTETSRVRTSDTITTPPVTQVTTIGTYVAPQAAPDNPSCTSGSYINSAGNQVCSPEVSSSAPNGATAKCADGTYSFSQSRRGTCSSHGGVAAWL